MAQRRFGPTLGAGVVIIEKEAERILEAAPLGVTGYPGILEKGDEGVLISTFSKKQFVKKCGGIISESSLGDASLDFWDHSQGAGELHLLRVTDGTGRKASLSLYSRGNPMVVVARIDAHNVGRWGGRKQVFARAYSSSTDLTETTLATGTAMKRDEWKGAILRLEAVTARTYEVISNTAAGVIEVRSDLKMKTDTGSSLDFGYVLELQKNDKNVEVQIDDGEADPVNLFSLNVFIDGLLAKRYPNLSLDTSSLFYASKLINDDSGNDEILFTDLNTPATVDANKRPATEHGLIDTVTATVLTRKLHQFTVSSLSGANPAVALGTTSDVMKFRDTIVVTITAIGPTVGTVVSANAGSQGPLTVGTLFTPPSSIVPPFTLSDGVSALLPGDVVTIDYFPFEPDALKGGLLIPDHDNARLVRFRITANTHKAITVALGDMTSVATIGDHFVVVAPAALGSGYDGITAVVDADFIKHYDFTTSLFNRLKTQNKGLVKLSTPGKTSFAIQRAGLEYAEANNWQYRVEIPDTVTTETGAVDFINNTGAFAGTGTGRSDFGKVSFPSYADVNDTQRPGLLKRLTLTGQIHGREALVARAFDGYHKVAAGVDVTLPRVVKLPVEGLNEEVLNPVGINVVKFIRGSAILWGARSISVNSAFKFVHQRELLSHYENRLLEGFDFAIFSVNDPSLQVRLHVTLRAFFTPEFLKGAVRGNTFDDAVQIKIDNEINTDLTRAAGDLFAELKLRLADTVERFIITISKAGVFETLA